MADTRRGKARQQMERRATSARSPRARFVDSDEPELQAKELKLPLPTVQNQTQQMQAAREMEREAFRHSGIPIGSDPRE